MASGSADGIVKVWDLHRGFATHSFKGHGGVISAITFHAPHSDNPKHLHVITASVDGKIHIYQMVPGASNSRPMHILEGHTSVPRGLAVSEDGKWLLSGGRDGVVLLWDYEGRLEKDSLRKNGTGLLPRTFPVFERIEALGLLPRHDDDEKGGLRFFIGGEKGEVSIWETCSGKKTATLGASVFLPVEHRLEEQNQIVDIL